jgi:hypothetical protein
MGLDLMKQRTEVATRSTAVQRRIGAMLLCVGVLLGTLSYGCAGTAKVQNSTPNNPANPQTQTFNVSGTISPAGGGNGTMVALSGATAMSTVAGGSGAYSFVGLADGTYTVTPSRTGYTFNPTTQAATVSGKDVTGLNFVATAQTNPTFSISGTIAPNAGGGGATVILSGAAGATSVANSAGAYSFSGLAKGNYTVTPNRSGFLFTPPTQSLTINGTNATGVNFTATAGQTHSVTLSWTPSVSTVVGYNIYRSTISGGQYVKINPGLVGGVNYSDSSVIASTTYFYVTTAVNSSNDESGFSNEVPATIP